MIHVLDIKVIDQLFSQLDSISYDDMCCMSKIQGMRIKHDAESQINLRVDNRKTNLSTSRLYLCFSPEHSDTDSTRDLPEDEEQECHYTIPSCTIC